MKNIFFYDTIVGSIGIGDNGKEITDIFFGKDYSLGDFKIKETELIKEALGQLMEYFKGIRINFELPLYFNGTEFQNSVWNALREIPYGETRTYKEIAEAIGNSKACRAVGMANNKNPIGIVIPCHRVIGSNGGLIGYGGGIEIKKKLLDLEKNNIGI